VNVANEFRTNGYIARVSIEHPKLQVSASINDTVSNSLPFFSQVFGGLGIGSVLLQPATVIPSDFKAMSFNVHALPRPKLEITAFWTHSTQHLEGFLNNDFELLNILVAYHFRKIQLEAGYIRSNQIFASYPDTLRQRFYLRIMRSARLL
jgi:hypothetical protein